LTELIGARSRIPGPFVVLGPVLSGGAGRLALMRTVEIWQAQLNDIYGGFGLW
jgi:hypothetical protein